MTSLFAWPEAARVDIRISRDRLFRAAGGSKTIRQLYEEQVERIDWAFKLFERSVNLRSADGVTEVEVKGVSRRLRRCIIDFFRTRPNGLRILSVLLRTS